MIGPRSADPLYNACPGEDLSDMIDHSSSRSFDIWRLLFFAALVIGTILRFWDLTGQSLSHPEIYIPGIDLIAGISEPPPRHNFLETLDWHFHSEPHPVGYYMAMWGWTHLAGTSVFALRLPSVIIGILTIWLVWRLTLSIFSRKVAAIASLLIAIHGFHIFWSQGARMYAPAAAWSVLATWALVVWMRSTERKPWLEAGYAASLIAGTQTNELFWAIPFMHLAWVSITMPAPANGAINWKTMLLPWKNPSFRIIQVQAMALALAAPEFIHSAILARSGAAPEPAPRFLVEYLNFGFLFQPSDMELSHPTPPLMALVAMGFCAMLLLAFARKASTAAVNTTTAPRIAFHWMTITAAVGVAIAFFLASEAYRHKSVLACFAILSVGCLWLPGLAALARSIIARLPTAITRPLYAVNPFYLLLLMLALVPPLLFYAASIKMSVLAPRAFLIFVPFLVILAAAGLCEISQKVVALSLGAATVALFGSSAAYFHALPHSSRDYKAAGETLNRELHKGDIVMVRPKHWADTPLFYYVRHADYIASDPAEYLAAHHPDRVWIPNWLTDNDDLVRDTRHDALEKAGYRAQRSWSANRARVELYIPVESMHQ